MPRRMSSDVPSLICGTASSSLSLCSSVFSSRELFFSSFFIFFLSFCAWTLAHQTHACL